jgi:CHAT domain-containing protein/Tfp pilus assembly protein PilF
MESGIKRMVNSINCLVKDNNCLKVNSMHQQKKNIALKIIYLLFFLTFFESTGNASATYLKSPIHLPLQITAETDQVHSIDISLDGKYLVYSLEKNGLSDLWVRSADPNIVILPRKLTNGPAKEMFPAISPDGKYVAYVGTSHDVKGDIYIINLTDQGATPLRLTGRNTEDGAPCFSPDGHLLYFHQKENVNALYTLCRMDLNDVWNQKAHVLPKTDTIHLNTDGSFPTVSPDGNKIAFVSFQNNPFGTIKVYDFQTKDLSTITDGQGIHFSPEWSQNGRYVLFSQISIDTDNDGQLSQNDNASICKIEITNHTITEIPLTSARQSSFFPKQVQTGFFFLSLKKGIQNCCFLPMSGEIPTREISMNQVNLAHQIGLRVPFDPYLTILAHYKVLDRQSIEKKLKAASAYEILLLFNNMNKNIAALQMCKFIHKNYNTIEPIFSLSNIKEHIIKAQRKIASASHRANKKKYIARLGLDLKKIAQRPPLKISFCAIIENVKVLLEHGDHSNDLLLALNLLNSLFNTDVKNNQSLRKEIAEALLLKAEIYRQMGKRKGFTPILERIVTDFSDLNFFASKAVAKILDYSVKSIRTDSISKKILFLRQLSTDNEQKIPLVSIGALIRIGDIYYNQHSWEKAKSVYSEVIGRYRDYQYQTASAKLALAEILYKEERFKKAIDLYEKEMDSRSYDDLIYRLAQKSYIRKSIGAGEYHYRLGEISSALKIFYELILYDSGIVEAHRGYIKCKAALGKNEESLKKYNTLLKTNPNNPVYIYAKGLCLTYLNKQTAIYEAQELIKKAISLKGQVEYFHQTLGYIYEVLETVYNQKGHLERALESYKKAYFLNNHVNNLENHANLVTNLGNSYFLLQQYQKAYEFYSLRNQSGIPFDNIQTEIMFFRRLGASAFQMKDHKNTISAYQKTIDLINERIDPQQQPHPASAEMDKVNQFLVGRILTPIRAMESYQAEATIYLKVQAKINREVFRISQIDQPPPSDKWYSYQSQMRTLVQRQKQLNKSIINFLNDIQLNEFNAEQIEQTLIARLVRVESALEFPERFIHLKAEMTDRIGLAYQEDGQWEASEKAFEKAFQLNNALKNNKNLAINMRQIGYTRYRRADSLSGKAKREILETSLNAFLHALDLLETYGVQTKDKKSTNALLDFTLQVYLNKTNTSMAAYGFSKEQETRLCETFISRIKLELGHLQYAKAVLEKQFAQYPLTKPIKPNDLYGVSLLYHRAGHLAFALNEKKNAMKYFIHSAQLAKKLQNPVSMALNTSNTATILSQIDSHDDFGEIIKNCEQLDTQTTQLLEKKKYVIEPSICLNYHNVMGIYYVHQPDLHDTTIEKYIHKFQKVLRAVQHFHDGLDILKSDKVKGLEERISLEYKSLFYLNLAETAITMRENKTAQKYFEKALECAQKGLLPDYEWRAYAGIGEYEKALNVLKNVTVMRAHCGVSEIHNAFSPYIYQLVSENKIEAAFNLSESISEIERYHRMASLFRDSFNSPIIKKIAPKIERIRNIRKRLKHASKTEFHYLQKELDQETLLLKNLTAPEKNKLSDIIDRIQDTDIKEQFIILCGLALRAETEAELIVNKRMNQQDNPNDASSYYQLIERYQALRSKSIDNRPEDQASDAITFLGPEPIEAYDVMEYLGNNDRFVKLIRIDALEKKYIAFEIFEENIEAKLFNEDSLKRYIKSNQSITYVAYDNLIELDYFEEKAHVFSATHFVRSVLNRNSLKRIVMGIPGNDILSDGYTLKNLDLKNNSFEMHHDEVFNTLIISNKIAKCWHIPTRLKEHASDFIGIHFDSDNIQSIQTLPIDFSNASLAILPNLSKKDTYLLTHLLSINGISSILVSEHEQNSNTFTNRFLDHYLTNSIWQSKHLAQENTNDNWILLGYKGMSLRESAIFAKQNFIKYVKRGTLAFKNNVPQKALNMFECALQMSEELPEAKQYVPHLYKYCRETAYKAKNLSKAHNYSKKLAEVMASSKPDTFEHADALLKLGLLSAKIEKFDQAIDALEEALDIVSNLELGEKQISVMTELGNVLEQATFYGRALETFESTVKLSKSLDKEMLIARQYENIGRIYDLRSSKYVQSIDSYQKALAIYEKLGGSRQFHSKISQIHLNIGRCQRLLGNFEHAEQSYKKALAFMVDQVDSKRLKASIRIEQANNAWFQGRYDTAFKFQRRCYQIAQSENYPLMQIISLNTSGLIWWTLGNNQKALKELNKALECAKKYHVRQDEIASTLNNLGIVKRKMNRFADALSDFKEAIHIDTKMGSKWAMAYDYRNTALTYLKMEDFEKSIPLFKKALELASEIGNRINETKAMLGLGDAYAAIQNIQLAKKYYDQAKQLSSDMCIRETLWRSIFGLARLDLHNGDQISAQKNLYEALDIIENIRADIKIEQLKDSFITDKNNVYETLCKLLADQKKNTEAFLVAERSRSRNFIDLLGNQNIQLNNQVDQAYLDRQKVIKSMIQMYEKKRAQAKNSTDRQAYQQSLSKLHDDYKDLMLDIQMNNPQLASFVSIEPIQIAQLQSSLDKDVALLSYYVLSDEVFVWVIKADGIHLFRKSIGRESLFQSILDYRRMIQNLEPLEEYAKSLFNFLFKPVINHLEGINILGIVPHRFLHYLSFATLMGEISEHSEGYLIDRFALFYLPNASILDYAIKRRKENKNMKVLAIGNPDLGDPVFDLPFAEFEVNSIKWNFSDITIMTRKKASELWIKNNIEKYGIIHLASHGEFDPINPLFSAIKLSKGEKNETDGNLETQEVFGLNLQADMVVLSACQTGLGKITPGDDIIGLNRAFFYAGTHTLISSLWRVSDISTAILIKNFYRQYLHNNKAESLRQAIFHVKKDYPHPGYWGAFNLVGDYY